MKVSSIGAKGLLEFCRHQPQMVFRNIGKFLPFYLNAFVTTSLMAGHLDYTRFILIGRSRTGSNLVRGSLLSHSGIAVFGDIFRRRDLIRWGLPFTPQSTSTVSLYQNNPVEFLGTRVFGKFPQRVSAVGFKTLYPHKHVDIWTPVEAYLSEQKSVKIVHIKRKNILMSHLSLKRVNKKRDQWANISVNKANRRTSPIYLDYEECLTTFEKTREEEIKYDTIFEDHDKIDVFYEDISRDYENEMCRIQEFLGVDCQVLKPLTHKQGKRTPAEEISNYFELKEKFKDTVWEEFFENSTNIYSVR